MAKQPIEIAAVRHDAAKRLNIPTAEFESVMEAADKSPVQRAYERRNRDLDPQLVWRGKDEQDWSDLVVQAPPLFIQEKVHPKALIDDLRREAKERSKDKLPVPDLFADFNGLPDEEAKTEFYRHDANWSNRMILGDSLAVMASLAEREGLRGQVQAIYIDPPYGIRFNSNFQWSTTSRDVKDGNLDHLTREPEQVRAFRDTWRDGIHSYLTYLRDRLTVARELLTESGSCFVQIGDENVHRVRALMDEVFGEENFVTEILVKKKGSQISGSLESVNDFIVFYANKKEAMKFRKLWFVREDEEIFDDFPFVDLGSQRLRISDLERRDGRVYLSNYAAFRDRYPTAKLFGLNPLKSGGDRANQSHDFHMIGRVFPIGGNQCWKHTVISSKGTPGMNRLERADRLFPLKKDVRFVRHSPTPSIKQMSNWWDGLGGASNPIYVVQSSPEIIKRCLLMTTDPGDLVLDPTCGSGTTAFAAEQWGRRWITIDTSRVALALTRARIMGAKFPYYLLADSPEGRLKETEVTLTPLPAKQTHNDIRQGFVYQRANTSTSGLIANNPEIDVIWEARQPAVEAARAALNAAFAGHAMPYKVETGGRAGQSLDFRAQGEVTLPSGESAPAGGLMEWEVPREAPPDWPEPARAALAQFWEARIARQKEIDASIAAKAEFEYLYDKPYEDKKRIRVAGPFTVESLSPHRTLAVDWNDELIDILKASEGKRATPGRDEVASEFAQMILENLRVAGVQQALKEDRIAFTSLVGWPGRFICAEGTFMEGGQEAESAEGATGKTKKEKKAGILIGPEFGTVSRPDLVAAAREAGDAGFDVLIACAFNFDAHSAEFDKLGRVPVLKARMNPDLHMGGDLKATSSGNLFVVFGEPDIKIEDAGDGMIRVKVFGVDVFKPQTGEVVSEGTDGIALWMLDTDYNEESFFVRHAYFLGANDPYKALKTTLKAEIDEDAWESLHSDTSRPFPKPASGRIAVKVINHLGDEVMKVFAV